jgi:hypothetical protein
MATPDAVFIQPGGDAEIQSIQAAADAAFDAALVEGRSAFDAYLEMSTYLYAGLSDDEVWLCPCCCKAFTPVGTLCVYCESDERDYRDEMASHSHLRHGRE